jgi:hypothetical protein
LRCAAALLGALLAGGAGVGAQVAATTQSGSPAAAAAAVLAGLAAAGCVMVAAAPARHHRPLWTAIELVQRRLSAAPVAFSGVAAATGCAIGAFSFAMIVRRLLSLPQDPWDDDQGAFLITAREIHDAGGVPWLWRALWSGEFGEANRQPLYLALLSLAPTFDGGVMLSAGIGAVTLISLVAGALRRSDTAAAIVFCGLLGTNGAFCLFSTRVVCDVLLVLWCGLTWMIHLPSSSESRAGRLSPLRCGIGGALMGLGWLTKGTGLALLAAYLAWIVMASLWPPASPAERQETPALPHRGKRRWMLAGIRLSCALAAFLAVGAPLLARNVARFGNPFHNLNSLLLFADRYEDLPGMVERQVSAGTAAREYLATHSLVDILGREAKGLVWEAFIIVRSLGPAPLDDARVLFGVPLALLALARMATRRSAADGLLLVWGITCWGLFAWYVPIAAGERFVLPLLAPILVLASEAVARGVGERGRPAKWAPVLLAGWCALWVVANWISSGMGARTG